MNLVSKIKAMFSIAGEQIIMNLKSAEFKKDVAFLHPSEDENVTYMIRNYTADILINNGESISAENFVVISKKAKEPDLVEEGSNTTTDKNSIDSFYLEIDTNNATAERLSDQKQGEHMTPEENNHSYPQTPLTHNPLRKAKITFTVYADEKDLINQMIKESGYKRTDYFIACFQNNQKKSVNKSFYSECEKVKKFRDSRKFTSNV